MPDHLMGDDGGHVVTYRAAGVHVAVEVREVAARHIDSYSMTGRESPGCMAEHDLDLLNLAGPEKLLLVIGPVTVPRPDGAVGKRDGTPVREYVNELGHEIGVGNVARDIQLQTDRPDNIERVVERVRRIAQDVISGLDYVLCQGPGREAASRRRHELSAMRGHRVVGIVGETVASRGRRGIRRQPTVTGR